MWAATDDGDHNASITIHRKKQKAMREPQILKRAAKSKNNITQG